MIIPWLSGLLSWNSAPLTWCLFALNCLIFLMMSPLEKEAPNLTRSELLMTGHLYAQFKNQEDDLTTAQLLMKSGQALRDSEFMANLNQLKAPSDRVAFENWKLKISEFSTALNSRPVVTFGLNQDMKHPMGLITYQFMHAGFWHFLGNMLLFLLFGATLERMSGGFLMVGIYLLGGVTGGLTYLVMNPNLAAPMVGASASLSALIAFYAVLERRKRIRFFYFLSPSPGYWGEIYLPTLVLVPLFFVEDLASYMASAAEFGLAVAHSAHLGGALFGFFVGAILRTLSFKSPRWEQILYASYSRSHNEAP